MIDDTNIINYLISCGRIGGLCCGRAGFFCRMQIWSCLTISGGRTCTGPSG